MIELIPIDRHNLIPILKLKVSSEQDKYVADNASSVAQGSVESASWYRAVKNSGGEFIGFVMLYDPGIRTEPLDDIDPDDGIYIWRLMVGQEFQKRGFGRAILQEVNKYVRQRGYAYVYTSIVEGEGSPKEFYKKLGFIETGRIVEGETELRLTLPPI